jgi:S-adenosylmethionine decarboxylase
METVPPLEMTITHAGKHLLVDLYGCSFTNTTPDQLKVNLEILCKDIGATVLYSYAHEFNNGGSSGAVILAESHCTWHHWIDEKFVAVDLFVCGSCNPELAVQGLIEIFKPSRTMTNLHLRGQGFDDESF